HHQRAWSRLHSGGNIKVRVSGNVAGLNSHVAVVVRLGVEHVSGGFVRDAHQRIVGCGFELVAERSSLRPTIEQLAGNDVALAARRSAGIRQDGRSPWLEIAPLSLVDFGAADENLARRKHDQTSAVAIQRGSEVGSVELVKATRVALDQDLAVDEKHSEVVAGIIAVGKVRSGNPRARIGWAASRMIDRSVSSRSARMQSTSGENSLVGP